MVTLIAMAVPCSSRSFLHTMQFIHWYETPFFGLATVLLTGIVVVTPEQPGCGARRSGRRRGAAYLALMAFFPTVYQRPSGSGLLRPGQALHHRRGPAPDFSRMVYSYGSKCSIPPDSLVYSGGCQGALAQRLHIHHHVVYGDIHGHERVRFMYNATPIFAILGGWDLGDNRPSDYKKLAKTYRGSTRALGPPLARRQELGQGEWHAVGAIFIGYMVIGSATWYGIDAGIPYETKDFDRASTISAFTASAGGLKPDQSGLWWFARSALHSQRLLDGRHVLVPDAGHQLLARGPASLRRPWDYGTGAHTGEHPPSPTTSSRAWGFRKHNNGPERD
jgi:hypothetical protein